MNFTKKETLSITSSHDSEESVKRVSYRPSANKRISALNVHEDRILRRKISAYHEIHKKEIAEVSRKLVEIRDSMKELATDPLYGNHSLQNVEGSGDGNSIRTPVTNEQKLKLGRSQSFPDLGDRSTTSTKTNKSLFPILKHGHHVVQSIGNSGKRAPIHRGELKPRVKSTGLPRSAQITKWQLTEHKKLERSKTAPVTKLQPLLITTPEMMRKKINISTFSRPIKIDEVSCRRRISPCLVETEPKTTPMHSPRDSETYVHRPKSTSDTQVLPSHSFSNDSKRQFNFASEKMLTKREANASHRGHSFSSEKNGYEQESPVAAPRSISKILKTINWK
ncbi:uncharacterized protein LOC111342443 [Stylophora pistillata]|uniref:uncharacterized protein LOC111342443 n=1 Tax=Stylophora pistillata TaxID=50429 RepID=UPI000C03BF8B|nr:uncharacterized protein LOC111342443 [Stylophora pistillata]